jgi:serine-type D-Ala-D-Ala carboxypeptidase (penicillin-binding protein 5/6)
MALLTRALIRNFPEQYAMYAERSFTYNDIEQPNRNRLLWRDRTVDGVKTGHTEAAGYCLVASALRGNMRLISVVMGTASDEARMRESQKLLSYGFRYFETQRLYEAGIALRTSELWYGDRNEIELGVAEDVYVTIPRGHYDELQAELHVPRVIEAPIEAGQKIGELRLRLGDEIVHKEPLVALSDAQTGGLFSRIGDGVYLFFRNLFGDD